VDVLAAADRERQEREAAAERRRRLGTETLGALLDRFIAYRAEPPKEARERPIRPATVAGWQSLSRGALASLRDLDPATLTARDVRRWHERVGAERGRIIANRALELLAVLYAWAMRTEDEAGEPLLASSPVVGVKAFAETPRARVLDSEELRGVWIALDAEPYGDALRLLLWTGARRSEATGAEWKEVDFKARLWRVPAERSKTGEPRSIPLSAPALRMLLGRREAAPEARWIFPSPVGAVGPVGSLQAVVRRVKERSGVEGWTIHDLRRVVRSGLSSLGVAPPIAEFILGHLPPRMVRTYDRHEPIAEAAVALEAWARRIESYVAPGAASGDVVPFKRR
jgi:integrase